MKLRHSILLFTFASGLALPASPLAAQAPGRLTTPEQARPGPRAPHTFRASVASSGAQANQYSQNPELTADGRFVVFSSNASNLVADDTNGSGDVFLHDLKTGLTTRVSVATGGAQADDWSGEPYVTPDGRFVAFGSLAANLDPLDTNSKQDVFVRDLWTGATERVSLATTGAEGDGKSYGVVLSDDGRFAAFSSDATNLAPGDANLQTDVFVRDRLLGVTEMVSVATGGIPGNGTSYYPSISADGRFISFSSDSDNFVPSHWNPYYQIYLRDRALDTTELISSDVLGFTPEAPAGAFSDVTPDGRYVAFASHSILIVGNDTNFAADVFVEDRLLGETYLVSVNAAGEQGSGDSLHPRISANGRYVVFNSIADNLVPDDDNLCADNFLHDLWTGETVCVTVAASGKVGNDFSWPATISADGRVTAFASHSSNLVPADSNRVEDVFARIQR